VIVKSVTLILYNIYVLMDKSYWIYTTCILIMWFMLGSGIHVNLISNENMSSINKK